MKKLKKIGSVASSRGTKPVPYRQNRIAQQQNGFVLRNDVFAFIGIFTSSQQQMSFCQKQTE